MTKTKRTKTSNLLTWIACLGALPVLYGVTGCSTGQPVAQGGPRSSEEYQTSVGQAGPETPEVNPPAKGSPADAAIGNEIYQTLMANHSLAPEPSSFMVKTRDGVVTLTGQVPSQTDKEQLRNAITGLSGVQHVDDSLLYLGAPFPKAPGASRDTYQKGDGQSRSVSPTDPDGRVR